DHAAAGGAAERGRTVVRGASGSARCARSELGRSARVDAAFHGYEPGLRGGSAGRRYHRAARKCPTQAVESLEMAIKDMWNSTLVYFGVREEEWGDEYYEDGTAANEDLERGYSERPN